MTITCPKCKTKLRLADDKAKPEGTRVKCPKCSAVLVYKGKAKKEAAEKEKEHNPAPQVPPVAEPPAPPEETAAADLIGEEQPARPVPAGEERPASEVLPPTQNDKPAKKAPAASIPPGLPKVSSQAGEETKKGLPGKGVMAGSAAGVLILLIAAVFFFRSSEAPSTKQAAVPQTSMEEAAPKPPAQPPVSEQEGPAEVSPAAPPPVQPVETDVYATPEEKALAMVKRSDVLLRMTRVEAIVNKWAQDNAGKIQVVGWQVKKIDDRQYLVSYTGMEGNTPKGFYFVADIQSGTVEDLAKRPDLQKQYNVHY